MTCGVLKCKNLTGDGYGYRRTRHKWAQRSESIETSKSATAKAANVFSKLGPRRDSGHSRDATFSCTWFAIGIHLQPSVTVNAWGPTSCVKLNGGRRPCSECSRPGRMRAQNTSRIGGRRLTKKIVVSSVAVPLSWSDGKSGWRILLAKRHCRKRKRIPVLRTLGQYWVVLHQNLTDSRSWHRPKNAFNPPLRWVLSRFIWFWAYIN